MPSSPAAPCSEPGCPHRKPCPVHRRRRPKGRSQRFSRAWRAKSRDFLARNPVCERCGAPATDAHHRVDLRIGGSDDESNLEALCKRCHGRETLLETKSRVSGRRKPGQPPISLVVGPPGAGKSTFVLENHRPGELIVDLDRLWPAISGLPAYETPSALLPAALAARDGLLGALRRGEIDAPRAWIVALAPKRRDREALVGGFSDVQMVAIPVPAAECIRRIDASEARKGRGGDWKPLIEAWWRAWEPLNG